MPILHKTETDAVISRLRYSRNECERRSIIVGRTYDFQQPVPIDSNLLLEHMHIVGPTGSGKTTRALIT